MVSHLPDYDNETIVNLIKNWIHDKDDRKMLYWHLIDGDTIQEISDKIGKLPEKGADNMRNWKERLVKCGIPEETADKIVNYLFKSRRTIELLAIIRLMEEVTNK